MVFGRRRGLTLAKLGTQSLHGPGLGVPTFPRRWIRCLGTGDSRVHLRPPSTNLSITFVMSCLELTGKHRGTANYSVRCISLLDRKSLSRVTPCPLGAYMPPSKVSSRWASEIAKSTWLNSPRLHPAGTELSQGVTLPLSAFFANPPSLRLLSPDEPGSQDITILHSYQSSPRESEKGTQVPAAIPGDFARRRYPSSAAESSRFAQISLSKPVGCDPWKAVYIQPIECHTSKAASNIISNSRNCASVLCSLSLWILSQADLSSAEHPIESSNYRPECRDSGKNKHCVGC
ncbi:uncharacterized protein CLUP02_06382 [Colletotrichum lupini]|uniref:Uncharacterized protein n=1 Tax=Colletotrichum lupini TaxID=145971 RepID=A0A9Q8SQT7_9PEZI|nr:uncharacterized protein CLUP02_06382 [Colletotrichum lupini]UQC80897.1 hypothetical protein CLUP02_06382 [Colletotrichum lupini]